MRSFIYANLNLFDNQVKKRTIKLGLRAKFGCNRIIYTSQCASVKGVGKALYKNIA